LKAASARLSAELRAVGCGRVWVQPVVVIWGPFPQGQAEQNGVVYLAGAQLAGWAQDRPPRIALREQRLIELALAAQLVAATPTTAAAAT
jgi:hypothetical protein